MEIGTIRDMLRRSAGGLFGLHHFPWELRIEADGTLTFLPEEEWRYFVIGFQGSNQTVLDIEYALCFAELELRIGFVAGAFPPLMAAGHPSRIYHPGPVVFQMMREAEWNFTSFLEVKSTDVENITLLCKQLENHDSRVVNMKRIAEQLLDLEELRPGSHLKFLAYFAILESLLTHPPSPKTPTIRLRDRSRKK